MNRIHLLLTLAVSLAAHAAEPITLHDALAKKELRCELTSGAPDRVTLSVSNSSADAVTIAIPAGAIGAGAEGTARMIFLQSAILNVSAKSTAEALLPAALLSSKQPLPGKTLRFVEETEPRLNPLLKRLSSLQDIPRSTAQLAAFCLLENITFADWMKYRAARKASESDKETHPSPAEVTEAIDVLGLLKEVAPAGTFALASDAELKLRALRNPLCRVKAMQLYGINLTGDANEYDLPSVSQLLHTKPGDNCPICRARAEMQKSAGDL